jgi:hypothetical protein
MSPMRYELGFYITEDGILHSRREKLRSYKILTHPYIAAYQSRRISV